MSKNLVSVLATGMIVADCDGTIAPHVESAHGMCMAHVIKDISKKAGVEYSQSFFDRVWKAELGKGIVNFTNQYIASLDQDSAAQFGKAMGKIENAETQYEDTYIAFSRANPEERFFGEDQPNPNGHYFEVRKGLVHAFQTAANNGIPVAVISNANQRVLEATLAATFKLAGAPETINAITIIKGKNTIEAEGYKAKPDRGAIFCAQKAVEEKIGRTVSLDNSIGLGDTDNDYKAFRSAGVGRIIACDNFKQAANEMDGPDSSGFLTIGKDCSVVDAADLFAKNRDSHHHAPKVA